MLHLLLQERLQSVVQNILPDANLRLVQVRPCPDPKFGDYQSIALMALARERKRNPRQIAEQVLKQLDLSEFCDKVEIAGPGFLNFRIKPAAISRILQQAARGEHQFLQPSSAPRTVVIDFSSPNVAKPMHVGHIRSTILGDCLARVLRLLGHRVITDNHIGDWGTQFGKLLLGWKTMRDDAALLREPLEEMGRIYKEINARFEADDQVKAQARHELLKLQSGDPENTRIWQEMIRLSLQEFDQIYRRLAIQFDHLLGESFYNPQLQSVVADLQSRGIARESEGATVVFFDDIPELKEQPALIRKSDGAANYTTTDLATLEYRLKTWQPDEIIYVTDARQQLHFKQLFAILERWKPDAQVKLTHVWFGMILGEDGKPFKTRTGENVKLKDLLDEAEQRAFDVVTAKNPDLPEAERREIARVIGLGAIKYSDLLPNRQSDYAFSWEKMLALTGNTAPYVQYAYTRIQSILRKAAETGAISQAAPEFLLNSAEELDLAKHLLNFGIVLEAVADEYRPNYLCNYLYDLASLFARFFEHCPVLKSEGQERIDRLALCQLTGRILRQGLNLLGIETTEKM
ncbi:MAG: arginine--tRNA ligase [Verrucomicrobiota bacterium]|nr:arginine--tRNA ligase [Verrucomicrobiota bacterium]